MGLFGSPKRACRGAREDAARSGRRRRSHGVGLGQRQRRHRQDARAHHAGAAPAARWRRAGAHPGAHLHQGGGGGDVDARVRSSRGLGDGERCGIEIGAHGTARSASLARHDAARTPAVCQGHRDAGRPQGADHPCLLRAPAAALSARSGRAAGLRNSRRPAARGPARRGRGRDADRSDVRQARSAAGARAEIRSRLCGRRQFRCAAGGRAAPARVDRCGRASRPRR